MWETREFKKNNQGQNGGLDERNNPGFLIFGGTSEGRKLAEFLAENEIPATLCVATEYGEEVLREDIPGIRVRTGRRADCSGGVEARDIPDIRVRTGRLDEREMEALICELCPLAVVDATHPYAEAVTENLRLACEKTGRAYYRLLRRETPLEAFDNLRVFDDCAAAADWLEGQTGNILLTTGMKELPEFAARLTDKSRIFARVLLQEDVPARAERLGLAKKQIICMQGPFSKEMNVATLHMTDAAFLVTKESGKNGGFVEKAEAARDAGAVCVVIRRPVKETGNSPEEICEILSKLWRENSNRFGNAGEKMRLEDDLHGRDEFPVCALSASAAHALFAGECIPGEMSGNGKQGGLETECSKTITLVGIGMGGAGQLTLEAADACARADCIIGARRMLETLAVYGMLQGHDLKESTGSSNRQGGSEAECAAGGRTEVETFSEAIRTTPMISFYKADEIVELIRQHPEYEHIVVAFSGDVGFYSGAKNLLGKIADTPELGAYRVRQLCGISSVAYFAAKLHMPWEDMALVSMHGRRQNLVNAVRTNRKVFALASDAASIRAMAEKLANFGLGGVRMYVGADLSYPAERIEKGAVRDFLNYNMVKAGESMYLHDCRMLNDACDSQKHDMVRAKKSTYRQNGQEAAVGCNLKNGNRPDKRICVAVFENPRAGEQICVQGIPDGAFVRGKVPMTKEEVRSISVSKLRLTRDAVVYDIGAGTGSVAVECARMADKGQVYAVEWKEDAWRLIAENRKRFALSNLEIVAGRAPGALADLPAPTHAFIGGSGGDLKRILKVLLEKNPRVRVVVNCITLETLGETVAAAPEIGFAIDDIVSVSIAKSKNVGDYHMMTGQNPVYVITLAGEKIRGCRDNRPII